MHAEIIVPRWEKAQFAELRVQKPIQIFLTRAGFLNTKEFANFALFSETITSTVYNNL